jgi:hypothetical protein
MIGIISKKIDELFILIIVYLFYMLTLTMLKHYKKLLAAPLVGISFLFGKDYYYINYGYGCLKDIPEWRRHESLCFDALKKNKAGIFSGEIPENKFSDRIINYIITTRPYYSSEIPMNKLTDEHINKICDIGTLFVNIPPNKITTPRIAEYVATVTPKNIKNIPVELFSDKIVSIIIDRYYNYSDNMPEEKFTDKVIEKLFNIGFYHKVPDSKKTEKYNVLYIKKDYRLAICNLSEKHWNKSEICIQLLKKLCIVFDEEKVRKELIDHPMEPIVGKLLVDNNIDLNKLDLHVLYGVDFNYFMTHHGHSFVKLTNKDECHNGVDYSKGGEFIDKKKFYPKDHCKEGGIYFTLNTPECISYFANDVYGVYKRNVKIPDDALVYFDITYKSNYSIDQRIIGVYPKFKTTKLILGPRVSLTDNVD